MFGLFQNNYGELTFRILNGLEQIPANKLDLERELFCIQFHCNRMTFEMQYSALEWIKKHNLFFKLFQNERFPLDDSPHNENFYEIR